MNRNKVLAALAMIISLAFGLPATAAPAEFSRLDTLAPEWMPLTFPNIERHSEYRLVRDSQGTQVVEARTDGGASGLIARLDLDPGEQLILRWRWKVSNVYQAGDARRKDGDDYPARLYVAFRFEDEHAGFFERLKRGTVKALFGEELPGNALNYIWANRLPQGRMVANPYTDQTMMVAVTSGRERVGQWVTVERDLVADYRQAFSKAPPRIVGIGIMSDADNTGDSATAWYGDIELITP
ncbi:DUF3047 domain-containing protein [Marinobacter sp. CA1]|uniref:DUF3047 domain-containing protein n=1 Tax=Marinobacter sp. CA1 TaxID=2817656 RepID=UPI001D063EB1|nr:DUF3047 domain-containing protein [Marinobacter sp. CA1]UDL05069.1 DUF3047 domain-containing protein [Marinobacter sp. CA1]